MKAKLLSLALLLCLAVANSFSQQRNMTADHPGQSGPIVVGGKVLGFYALKEKLKSRQGIFTVEIFDDKLQTVNQFDLEMPMDTEPIGGASNGGAHLLVFYNAERQFLNYLTVSPAGALLKERRNEKIGIWPESTQGLFAQVFPADSAGFYVVQPVKRGKTGYRVEKVGNDLTSIWDKSVVPEKGVAIFYSAKATPNELVFLELRQRQIQQKKFNFELVALDGQTGKERFSQPLFSEELLLFPTGQLLVEENQVVLSGMFFHGNKVKDKNSDGLFAAIFDLNGKKVQQQLHDWDVMQDAFSPYKKFLAKKPKIMMQSIVRQGDNYLLVGEIFQRSAGEKGKVLSNVGLVDKASGSNGETSGQLTLLDFAAFEISANDLKMKQITFCQKEERIIYQTDYALLDLSNDDFALALQASGGGSNFSQSEGVGNLFSLLSLDKNEAGEPVIYFYNESNPLNIYLGVAVLRGGDFSVSKYKVENFIGLVTGGKVVIPHPLVGGKVLVNEIHGKKNTWTLRVE